MKTLILGDIHGRDIWEDIFNKELPDRVIFMGDYFDSFDIPGVIQMDNFKNIIVVIFLVPYGDQHNFL